MRYEFLVLFVPLMALAQPNFQQQVQIASAGVAAAGGGGSNPTVVSITNVTTTTGGFFNLTNSSAAAGDLVLLLWADGAAGDTMYAIDSTVSGWTSITNASGASSGGCGAWYVVMSSTAKCDVHGYMTTGGGGICSLIQIHGQNASPLGTIKMVSAQANPSVSASPSAGSVIAEVSACWNYVTGTRTYRNGESEITYDPDSNLGTFIDYYKTDVSSGAATWGFTGLNDGSSGWSTVLVEIKK